MNTIEIPETGARYYMPENLSECDGPQYIAMCALFERFYLQEISYEEMRVLAVYGLLNMEVSEKKRNQLDEDFKFSNIYQLSELIDSFFEEIEVDGVTAVQPVRNYVNNHIPKIEHIVGHSHGPSDLFRNVTFGEYTDGLNLLMEYEKHKEPDLLLMLLATFYRPLRKNYLLYKKYNRRESYDSKDVEYQMEKFRNIQPGVAYGFYQFFRSFHDYLPTATMYMNGEEIELAKLFESSGSISSKMPGIGFKSIEYQLSESGVFGTASEVRKINLWETFVRLYDIVKRGEDDKARMKAEQNKTTDS